MAQSSFAPKAMPISEPTELEEPWADEELLLQVCRAGRALEECPGGRTVSPEGLLCV